MHSSTSFTSWNEIAWVFLLFFILWKSLLTFFIWKYFEAENCRKIKNVPGLSEARIWFVVRIQGIVPSILFQHDALRLIFLQTKLKISSLGNIFTIFIIKKSQKLKLSLYMTAEYHRISKEKRHSLQLLHLQWWKFYKNQQTLFHFISFFIKKNYTIQFWAAKNEENKIKNR